MHILHEDAQGLIFDVYPHISTFFILILMLTGVLYSFTIEALILELVMVCLTGFGTFAYLLLYICPLRITIDKNTASLVCRDISVIPTVFVKDDSKDEMATSNPYKKMSLRGLTKITLTANMPELATKMMNLFPINKHIGRKFCFIFTNNEHIDLYVGIWDVYRYRKALKKISSYLEIPFEEQK